MCKAAQKVSFAFFIVFLLLLPLSCYASDDNVSRFEDVPEGHWADDSIHRLRCLKIFEETESNEFGLGSPIKRWEFVNLLTKLMEWEPVKPETGSFTDNTDTTKQYYVAIETAAKNGAILLDTDTFRPEETITREEAAVMIVRALGYDSLAKQLDNLEQPFADVINNRGYISITKDLGIITGFDSGLFKPYDILFKEDAAVIMARLYEKINNSISELHAFYAIRSYPQRELIKKLDSVSFVWSSLQYDSEKSKVVLNTTSNNNLFSIPEGFSEQVSFARENGTSAQLTVFAENNTVVEIDTEKSLGLIEYIVTNPKVRSQVIKSIVNCVNLTVKDNIGVTFDGVVIDFECMKGEVLKNNFNIFLSELKQKLDKTGKSLYVTVHPKIRNSQEYYDGYDYRTIGEIADKVILMAHDYNSKGLTDSDMENGYTDTPLTPIDEIYYALKGITDKNTGVQDINKIWLQISFDSAQWKLQNGKVINEFAYRPNYQTIKNRLLQNDVDFYYSSFLENPYIKFFDSNDETHNILWYEDSRSVNAKIKLAQMFGIKGVSLWRLGNIPDYNENKEIFLDVWQQILNKR